MSCTRYKAGPWYDGSTTRRYPWKGFIEVNEVGQWRDTMYNKWRRFDSVTLDELVSRGYWELDIPEELRVSEGL